MIPEELEKLVIKHKNEGHLPFFVNCTTGTTVYGAYDPISEIAGIFIQKQILLTHKILIAIAVIQEISFKVFEILKRFT